MSLKILLLKNFTFENLLNLCFILLQVTHFPTTAILNHIKRCLRQQSVGDVDRFLQ